MLGPLTYPQLYEGNKIEGPMAPPMLPVNRKTIKEQIARNKAASETVSKREAKKLRNENKRHNKVIQGSRSKAASTEHIIQTDKARRFRRSESKQRNFATNNLKQKQASTQTANAAKINAVKPQSFNWNAQKKKLMESGIGKKFFSKKGMLVSAAISAGAIGLMSIGSRQGGNSFVNSPVVGSFDSRSSYIPNSYKRGYSDIKEALTDFGSRVHLDKTIKSLVKPINSTRHNVIQTVQSVQNDNIALFMHKNAINHTRY